MGLINRVKTWAVEVLTHTDLNAEFDNILNSYNGNIEDANIKSDADIDPGKIGDYSVDDDQANTVTDPNDTANPSKATTLEGELERLRHNDIARGVGTSAIYYDLTDTATASIGPGEAPYTGHNLVVNGSMQSQSGGAGTAPDGWTLVNAPGTAALAATSSDEGDALAFHVIANGSSEGVQQIIGGLKASTRYVIGCRARSAVNAASFFTLGGLASGSYKNTTTTIAVHSSDYTTYSLVVESTSSADDITIRITAPSSTSEFYVYDVFMYELSKDPRSVSGRVYELVTSTVNSRVASTDTAQWVECDGSGSLPDWRITVTPSQSNSRVVIDAVLNVSVANDTDFATQSPGYIRLTANGSPVAGPFTVRSTLVSGTIPDDSGASSLSFKYVNNTPTPGTALAYAIEYYDDLTDTDNDYLFDFALGAITPQSQIYALVEVAD